MFDNTKERIYELDKQIGAILNEFLGQYIYIIIIIMIIIAILLILFSYKEYKSAVKEKRKEILLKEYRFRY